MSDLLDTNICSAHIRRPSGLIHRFVQHLGQLFALTVVLAEHYVWAYQVVLQEEMRSRRSVTKGSRTAGVES
jgi:predicted nucleic acid-binding protein